MKMFDYLCMAHQDEPERLAKILRSAAGPLPSDDDLNFIASALADKRFYTLKSPFDNFYVCAAFGHTQTVVQRNTDRTHFSRHNQSYFTRHIVRLTSSDTIDATNYGHKSILMTGWTRGFDVGANTTIMLSHGQR